MPTKPKIVTLTNSSADVLNAIRNNATVYYRDHVPIATADAESIRTIGAIIMDYTALQNEFINSLVNRIGRVVLTSKSYTNPWSMFKRGTLDFGETVEEIFANIAQPFTFDPEVAETELYKREIPDVRTAFHIMNYQKFYKATISRNQLNQAFLSEQGVIDLIAAIVESMYTAANYDEFQVMKYMLARWLLDGKIRAEQRSGNTPATMVTDIKTASNNFTFLSPDYNPANVYNHAEKNDQFLIIPSAVNASIDVNVLAAAFNMDKAEFMGHTVLVDGFNKLDIVRLATLFDGDDTYQAISIADLNALDNVGAVLVDRDFFMVFDNLMQFDENYNGQGLYWNYFYHVWKTFSISPFANAIAFTSAAPSVTSVTVTPDTVTASAGAVIQLTVEVETSNFASKAVTYTSSSSHAKVSASGLVTLDSTASGSITITVKSVADPSKSDTCVITVS